MQFNYTDYKNKFTTVFDVLKNSGLGHDVIYKKNTETYNETTRKRSVTTDSYSITAIRTDSSLEAMKGSSITSAISFNSGQKYYLLKYSDCPRDPYDPDIVKDYVVDSNKEYQIKKAIPLQNILVYLQI